MLHGSSVAMGEVLYSLDWNVLKTPVPAEGLVDSIPKRNAGEFVEHFNGRLVIKAFPRTIIQ